MKRPLFLSLVLALGIASLHGQYREERRREEPRVILFQHADFSGDALVLYPGESIDNFSGRNFGQGSGLNDAVSSIRVEGGAEVYVYENARFRGAVMRLTESVRNLTGRLLSDNPRDNWNDRISSIRLERSRGRPGPDRNVNYEAVITRAYQDLLGRAPDESGMRSYRSLMIDQGWTDLMVREHLRRSAEFRNGGADAIIRRAYQDILGREVDSSGLQHYRHLINERNWTEGDVRDDLRRSDEFKHRPKTPAGR